MKIEIKLNQIKIFKSSKDFITKMNTFNILLYLILIFYLLKRNYF